MEHCAPRVSLYLTAGEHPDWWKELKVVHVPTRDYPDGGFGFLITSAARDGKVTPSIVAFESHKDCEEVHWLWDSWPDSEAGSTR